MSAAAVAIQPKGPGKRKTDLSSQVYSLGSSPSIGSDAVPRTRQQDIEALMAGMKSKLAGAVGKANAEKDEAMRMKERLERDVKDEKGKVEVLEKGLKKGGPPSQPNSNRDIHALAKKLGAKIEGTVGQQLKSYQQLEKELEVATKTKEKLEKDNEGFVKDKARLEKELEAAEARVKSVQVEKEGLAKDNEALVKHREALDKDLGIAKGQNKDLTKKLGDLEVTVESLQRDKSGLQTELADAKAEIQEAREEAKKVFERHVNEIKEWDAKWRASQDTLDAVYILLEQSNNYLDSIGGR